MKINERHLWAAKILNVKSDDHLLEIGCGSGITTGLVAEKLKDGTLHAIDRSEAMIKQAEKRNKILISENKIRFIHGHFGKLKLPLLQYNKIFAFNVNLFLKNNYRELDLIKKLIGGSGFFFLLYQPPFDKTKDSVQEAKNHLKKHDFHIVKIEIAPFQPAPTFCITVKN